jgi:hypothetical protein
MDMQGAHELVRPAMESFMKRIVALAFAFLIVFTVVINASAQTTEHNSIQNQ